MTTVTLEDAQSRLGELIRQLTPEQPLVITSNNQPVAQLALISPRPQPQFGSCRGKLTIITEDNEYLKDFAEYM